jgi:DNA-directed RNA polymerase specialized sigma subunit
MALTDRERRILELANQGLSDYKIARKLNINPPTVSRLHKNAQRKLIDALADVQWATNLGLDPTEFEDANEE